MYDVNNEGHSLDASVLPQDAPSQELDEDRKILSRRLSETSANSSNQEICRICHWEGDGVDALVAPCYCSGSLRFVHQRCLQQWIKSSDIRCCELCKFQFVMNTKLKDFSEWECLQMGPLEKRKLVGKVAFHCIVLTCTLWSFYVLIERTIEELERGALEWPFWTKLTVVAFGLFGVSVFMHIQCKIYFNLCRRWRAFNRVIYIDNAPEKPALPPEAMPGISSVCSAPLVKPAECVVAIPPPCLPPTEPGAVTDHPETYALLNA